MVHHASGLNPTWDEEFNIKIDDCEDLISLSCFDKDIFMNDLIGETTMKVSVLVDKFGGGDRYATLCNSGQKTVHLLIKATFQEDSRTSRLYSQFTPSLPLVKQPPPFSGDYSPQIDQHSQLST